MTSFDHTTFDADPVKAAWAGTGEEFSKCLAPLDHAGVSFGFNFELKGDSRNFTKYTSPMVKDDAASTCIKAIYTALEADPAFAKEGLESGQIECDGSFSRY